MADTRILEQGWGPLMKQAVQGAGIPFYKVPGKNPKIIEMAVNQRMKYDWWDNPTDGRYMQEDRQRAKASFDEYNEIVGDTSKILMKRVLLFEKSAIPELESLGFELKIHKFELPQSYWNDYDFHQVVEIHDNVANWGNPHLRLTWGFRSWLQIGSNWTNSNSENDPKATFAQLVLTHGLRMHTDTPAKWHAWVEQRRQYLQEKGWQPS